MVQRFFRLLSVAATAALVSIALGGESAQATELRRTYTGDLFYNYYTEPGYGGLSAELYVSPRPTPPLVGHVYHTYPPLMPHEFLYQHKRTYVKSNCDGSKTATSVRWFHNPLLGPKYLFPYPRGFSNASYPKHF